MLPIFWHVWQSSSTNQSHQSRQCKSRVSVAEDDKPSSGSISSNNKSAADPSSTMTTQKATTRHVISAVVWYLLVPLLLLTRTSRYHDQHYHVITSTGTSTSNIQQQQHQNNITSNALPSWLQHLQKFQNSTARWSTLYEYHHRHWNNLDAHQHTTKLHEKITTPYSKWLVLGFDSSATLWLTVYEKVLGTISWGLTFLFIRMGCNPDTRHSFFAHYWRGTVLSCLAVGYAGLLRLILLEQWFHTMEESDVVSQGLLVGVCWGITNVLIRRRLDPALCSKLSLARTWRDVFWGSCSFAANASFQRLQLVKVLKRIILVYATPLLADIITSGTAMQYCSTLWDLHSPDHVLQFWIDAAMIGIAWGLAYLFIRRGCNPDTRSKFWIRYGTDAMWGSIALAAHVLLKRALFKWVPIWAEQMHDYYQRHDPYAATITTTHSPSTASSSSEEL